MTTSIPHSSTESGYPATAQDGGHGGTPHHSMTMKRPDHSEDSGFGESGSQEWLPNHPKTGDWFSLKGDTISAYEHPTLHAETFENMRGQDPSMAPSWSESIEGTGATTGSDMYSSDIENHEGHTN